jgi:hypothetical protein
VEANIAHDAARRSQHDRADEPRLLARIGRQLLEPLARRHRVCPAVGNLGVEPARRNAGVPARDRFEDRGRERHEFEALGEDDRRDAPTLRENGAAAREPDWTVLAVSNLADRRRVRYVTCREPRHCGEVTEVVIRV